MLRCDERLHCRVEARALADGAVRWSAPAVLDDSFLGVSRLSRDNTVTPPVWPASFVIVHAGPHAERYEARDVRTGRVLAGGNARRTVTASLGDVLLRADATTLTATDVSSGRVLWRRPTDGAMPVRTVDLSSRTLAVVDGALLLADDLYTMPDLHPGDPLRTLDPRSGQVTEHVVGVSGYVSVIGTGTAPPGIPVVRKFGETEAEDQVVVDGRRYVRDGIDPDAVAATPAQAAFRSTLSVYGLGRRSGIEVYDRRGGRVARFVAAHAYVRSAGERLVISTGEGDAARAYVVDAT